MLTIAGKNIKTFFQMVNEATKAKTRATDFVFYIYTHFSFPSLHTHLNKHRKNQTSRRFSSFLDFLPKSKADFHKERV